VRSSPPLSRSLGGRLDTTMVADFGEDRNVRLPTGHANERVPAWCHAHCALRGCISNRRRPWAEAQPGSRNLIDFLGVCDGMTADNGKQEPSRGQGRRSRPKSRSPCPRRSTGNAHRLRVMRWNSTVHADGHVTISGLQCPSPTKGMFCNLSGLAGARKPHEDISAEYAARHEYAADLFRPPPSR